MSARMTAELADDALRMAIVRRRPPGGCIRHSDHGSQYVSLLIGKTMREAGIRPSMGSIASPWDNAAMESLMGLVKAECVHARTFETRDQAALEIFDYIECFYNRVRTPLRARQPQPRGVRGEACAGGRFGGVEGVNEIGVNSSSSLNTIPPRSWFGILLSGKGSLDLLASFQTLFLLIPSREATSLTL